MTLPDPTVLRRLAAIAVAIGALSLASCGGDGDDDGDDPERAGTPAAQACSPQADQALEEAEVFMKSDDFDGALATIKPYLECPKVEKREAEFRTTAARTSLAIAKRHLATATNTPGPENSPQAAVSLARNSLRYEETAEARAFLEKAEAALERFKAKYGPRPDEEPGGPPPGAGEGGPPDDRGGE